MGIENGRSVRWVVASVLLEVDLHLHDLAAADSPRSAYSVALRRRPTTIRLELVELVTAELGDSRSINIGA